MTLTEGSLTFSFSASCTAVRYDTWAFYQNQFQKIPGTKAVDYLCINGSQTWLIEVKDYRSHPRTKPTSICDEVALKVRDTLAGLAAARVNANVPLEKQAATRALRSNRWRVALHLEQPPRRTKLRPKALSPVDVLQKLKGMLKAIDAHPKVVDRNSLHPDMCWTVSSGPARQGP